MASTKTKRIRMLVGLAGNDVSYAPGDVIDVPADWADAMVSTDEGDARAELAKDAELTETPDERQARETGDGVIGNAWDTNDPEPVTPTTSGGERPPDGEPETEPDAEPEAEPDEDEDGDQDEDGDGEDEDEDAEQDEPEPVVSGKPRGRRR